MRALETLMKDRAFDHEISHTKAVALTLQPQSYADFDRHPEFEEAFRRWTQKDNYRGLDFARLWGMALNCKHALRLGDGAIAELGVYQGQSAALLSLYAEQFSRNIYLCDTFNGFAEQQYDARMDDYTKAAFKDGSLLSAQAVVGNYSGVKWIVGMFPDSVTDEMRNETFAFVSIDCDIYEPISEGLKFFWPRMRPGGIIFVHDYGSGYWPGATKAVDDFCAVQGVAGCLLPDLSGTYIFTRNQA